MANLAELSDSYQGAQNDGVVTDLSIVIVSWNVRDYLKSCLSSIVNNQGDLLVEVIVVDSGSTDGSPQMIRDEYPDAQILLDRIRVAGQRWPTPNELPVRVNALVRSVEGYYESGENDRQRVL